MARRRLLTGLTVSPVVVVGCGQLLGLEGESVVNGLAADASTVDQTTASDARQVECNGKVTSADDPLVGCGSPTCEACSVPFARDTKCVSSACAVATCAAGRADCNGRGDDGCEADLLSAETCGACTVSCPTSAPFCGNDGTAIRCLVACPGGQTTCGKSCVDTTQSLQHCGQCDKPCTTSAVNADPVCSNSTCSSQCRAGQELCDPQDPSKGCGTLKTFYRDADNDQYGTVADTRKGCVAPPGYVAESGDCNDDNGLVHPGQLEYFSTGYAKATGGSSYDYDCNGLEDEGFGFAHFAGCGQAPACGGSGYVVDPATQAFCGSTKIINCSASASGSGSASASMSTICIQTLLSSSPIRCH